MGLSATKFFKHWPEMAKEYNAISLQDAWIETFKHSGERMVAPLKVADRLRDAGLDPDMPPGTFQMRPLVYKMFISQVKRLGLRVEFGKRVVDYFEDEEGQKAGVVTDQGDRYEAHVVIAADGKRACILTPRPMPPSHWKPCGSPPIGFSDWLRDGKARQESSVLADSPTV